MIDKQTIINLLKSVEKMEAKAIKERDKCKDDEDTGIATWKDGQRVAFARVKARLKKLL